MSNKRVIWTNPDGTVSVLVPAPGVPEAAWRKDVPADATDAEEVDVADIPADRTFRNAWKKEGKQCAVDVEKAKGICHERRRAKRDEEFLPLDRAVTIPGKAAEAEAQREAVRQKHADIQTAIDAATTVDELKAAAADVL
jgi:hypothetical protein